ncbi:thermonuclease family protein [Planomonospora sp. ID82291]|uniref:thermonuclease family protein n=1 Tax=Planomonospora sp. ID82291 TaxID=2738136 RepID=UPI0018C387B6|nr:thermonuclease family protein [Planomonospora sp. ID82291]MBG0818980.1 thermonuclease family protein [Planomonospora sp. ID82291]
MSDEQVAPTPPAGDPAGGAGHVHTGRCRCIKPKATAPAAPDLYVYAATVAKVVDGDTLDLMADLGFAITVKVRARLVGVYAPELGTPEGAAAADFTRAWVAEHGPGFLLKTSRDRKERYGRYLATLTPVGGGQDLGAALLAAGHATAQD